MDDRRFDAAQSAPIFKKQHRDKQRIKLDERFQTVLTDDRFRVAPGQVDKYGRKAGKASTAAAAKELEEFYQVDDADGDDKGAVSGGKEGKNSSSSSSSGGRGQRGSLDERLEYLNKLSRGEISGESSSDDVDDEDEADEADVKAKKKHKSPLTVQEGSEEEEIPTGDAAEVSSCRLAMLHCEWDSLKAGDLFVILQSFCAPGQRVSKVVVYPSDFGLERMAHEARHGPVGIWKGAGEDDGGSNNGEDESGSDGEEEGGEDFSEGDVYDGIWGIEDENEEDEDTDKKNAKRENAGKRSKEGDFQRKPGSLGVVLQTELVRRGKAQGETLLDGSNKPSMNGKGGGSIDMVALREYELSKLRYYFAIATMDSKETTQSLYDQLDGVELEHSSMALDLRFVPDEVDFAGRQVRDSSSGQEVTNASYAPPDFVVNALQHTDVKCSWEAGDDDRHRKLTTMSQWRDLNESDLQQFLASDDDDDDDDDDEENEEAGRSDGRGIQKQAAKGKGKGKDRASMRKMLLGDSDGEGEGDEDEDEDEEGGDSFFLDDRKSETLNDSDDDGSDSDDEQKDGNGEGTMTMSYVPSVSREALQAKARLLNETPFEVSAFVCVIYSLLGTGINLGRKNLPRL